MLHTVLPGLALCMTLLNGSNNNDSVVNVAIDSDDLGRKFKYTTYLDAAMILLRAAKRKVYANESKFPILF